MSMNKLEVLTSQRAILADKIAVTASTETRELAALRHDLRLVDNLIVKHAEDLAVAAPAQDGDFVVQYMNNDHITDEEWMEEEEQAVRAAKGAHLEDGGSVRVLTRDSELVYERKAATLTEASPKQAVESDKEKKSLIMAIYKRMPIGNKHLRGGKHTIMFTGNSASAYGVDNYTNVDLEDLSIADLKRAAAAIGAVAPDAKQARRAEIQRLVRVARVRTAADLVAMLIEADDSYKNHPNYKRFQGDDPEPGAQEPAKHYQDSAEYKNFKKSIEATKLMAASEAVLNVLARIRDARKQSDPAAALADLEQEVTVVSQHLKSSLQSAKGEAAEEQRRLSAQVRVADDGDDRIHALLQRLADELKEEGNAELAEKVRTLMKEAGSGWDDTRPKVTYLGLDPEKEPRNQGDPDKIREHKELNTMRRILRNPKSKMTDKGVESPIALGEAKTADLDTDPSELQRFLKTVDQYLKSLHVLNDMSNELEGVKHDRLVRDTPIVGEIDQMVGDFDVALHDLVSAVSPVKIDGLLKKIRQLLDKKPE